MKTVRSILDFPSGSEVHIEIDTPLMRVKRGIKLAKARGIRDWRERLKKQDGDLDVYSARLNPMSILFGLPYFQIFYDLCVEDASGMTPSQMLIAHGFDFDSEILGDAEALNAIWRKIWQEV